MTINSLTDPVIMLDDIELKYNPETAETVTVKPEESAEESPVTDKRVLCRNCHGYVAEINDRIRINDSDYHIFRNPMGLFFRVICFSRADGVLPVTEYTYENTWFSNYSWSIALCLGCHTHLGWHYRSENSVFYGLIADRLTGV